MEDELTEGKLFATFEKYDEYVALQASFLSLDLAVKTSAEEERREILLLQNLTDILDEYQEQSYLLDPFLERLVPPVVEVLKSHAKDAVSQSGSGMESSRIGRVALLLYHFTKCRGYKTITRFFPHEIADLSIALDYIAMSDGPIRELSRWPLRYVVLLWLSLIIMIPFDLAQFDDGDHVGRTASTVESVGKEYLGKAGLEREGAAILLSRIYMRKDTLSSFYAFVDFSNNILKGPVDVFTSIGLLQVLCEVVKSGPVEQIQSKLPQILSIGYNIDQSESLKRNTVVRKFKTKLFSRVALRLLPTKAKIVRAKGRELGGANASSRNNVTDDDDDIDVPEDVETVLEELFQALQDKDTIVRWSAAKAVARISERLPTEYADQVLDTITGLYSIHSIAAASLYDLPALAESTWHGASLACAEMARRNLIPRQKLPELVEWLSKALYFDIRKGAHSIGSNVRDAAAYVLWALARAQDASALAPHANTLAWRLVTVALYDREIHIRRAASAAFQEHVGRMGLFPHGIDVLRKTDFYAVSVRRSAFLAAAPQVAEHIEYQPFLIQHILNVTLRHWDQAMRRLGAQSLKIICEPALEVLGPDASHKAASLFDSVDITDIHGGLLALVELSAAYQASQDSTSLEPHRRQAFRYLARISQEVAQTPRNELVTEAACYLIANSISLAEIQLEKGSSVPHWRAIVEYGLRHRSSAVQEAAASAMAAVSKLVDCSLVIKRYVPILHSANLGRLLGVLDYSSHSHDLPAAVQCLLSCVNSSSTTYIRNVEARRNCFTAMPEILSNLVPRLSEKLSPAVVRDMYDALQSGLEDYTIDQRGDIGSWIRIACIRGLATFSEILFSNASNIPNFEEYLPAAKYHDAVGGILKQGVERLDNVRSEAGDHFLRLLLLPLPKVSSPDPWRIHRDPLMKELFLSEVETVGWNDGAWLFPRAVRLLGVQQYRKSVMTGLILSVGSMTDSTHRPVSASLVAYANAIPVSAGFEKNTYDLVTFVGDLLDHARSNAASNSVVVPVFQAFNILMQADALERLQDNPEGLVGLKDLVSFATRNVPRIKSIHRILESMKILVNALAVPSLFTTFLPGLSEFLAHQFPKIRTDCAEYLYLALQSKDFGKDTDEAEEVLLETEWSSSDPTIFKEGAERCIQLLARDN